VCVGLPLALVSLVLASDSPPESECEGQGRCSQEAPARPCVEERGGPGAPPQPPGMSTHRGEVADSPPGAGSP